MIVLKQFFHKVGPKTKSRRKVIHDIKKVRSTNLDKMTRLDSTLMTRDSIRDSNLRNSFPTLTDSPQINTSDSEVLQRDLKNKLNNNSRADLDTDAAVYAPRRSN